MSGGPVPRGPNGSVTIPSLLKPIVLAWLRPFGVGMILDQDGQVC
jgi:hypothetical protein